MEDRPAGTAGGYVVLAPNICRPTQLHEDIHSWCKDTSCSPPSDTYSALAYFMLSPHDPSPTPVRQPMTPSIMSTIIAIAAMPRRELTQIDISIFLESLCQRLTSAHSQPCSSPAALAHCLISNMRRHARGQRGQPVGGRGREKFSFIGQTHRRGVKDKRH